MMGCYKQVQRIQGLEELESHIKARWDQGFRHFLVTSVFDGNGFFKGMDIESFVSTPSNTDQNSHLLDEIKKLKERNDLFKTLLKELL